MSKEKMVEEIKEEVRRETGPVHNLTAADHDSSLRVSLTQEATYPDRD